MKIIKVNGIFFTVESINHFIEKSIYEVENMSIYSSVQTKSLGMIPSVNFEKLREKKSIAIAIIKTICACKGYIYHTNIMKASLLIQELNIKREDLNYSSLKCRARPFIINIE